MFTFRKNGHFYEKIGKKEKPICIDDEIPFEVPDSWELCRLENIAQFNGGYAFKSSEFKDEGIRVIRISDFDENGFKNDKLVYYEEKEELDKFILENNDILMAMTGGTVGKTVFVTELSEKMYVNQRVADIKISEKLNIEFIYKILQSNFIKKCIHQNKNSTNDNISMKLINSFIIPIPPYKEQIRILDKINRLLVYVNDYNDLKVKLDKLNSEFPDKLKSSILQEAIQGKLVPQDLNDEPSSVLLEKINDEKERLIKEKKIKRNKNKSFIYKNNNQFYEKIDNNKPICIDNEIPFEIPNSWEWVRLDTICKYIQRGKSPKYSEIKMYPVVAQKCNQWSGFSLEKAKFLDPKTVDSYKEERILQNKDIMWNSTGLGTLGRVGLYDESVNKYDWAVADSHVTIIRPFAKYVFQEFIYLFLASPTVQLVIESKAGGSTKQKELNLSTIKNYLIPLAPHNEQKRIIDKVFKLNQILG